MGKQLVIFITCECELRAPFCNIQSRVRTHTVLVIGLYELLGRLLRHFVAKLNISGENKINSDKHKDNLQEKHF
jgi:hypothetical protein